MEEKLYVCIRDLQGGSFAVGRIGTAKYWKKVALEWCEQDDSIEMAKFIKKTYKGKNLEKIIDEIRITWELEIEEYLPWKFEIKKICDIEEE